MDGTKLQANIFSQILQSNTQARMQPLAIELTVCFVCLFVFARALVLFHFNTGGSELNYDMDSIVMALGRDIRAKQVSQENRI